MWPLPQPPFLFIAMEPMERQGVPYIRLTWAHPHTPREPKYAFIPYIATGGERPWNTAAVKKIPEPQKRRIK